MPGGDQSAACLAEAASLFAELQAVGHRRRQPLDARAYNSFMAVLLAAGDHAGVLQTFERMEAEEEAVLPDEGTLNAVIAACQEAGWKQREEQYRQLLQSSRLLGALGK